MSGNFLTFGILCSLRNEIERVARYIVSTERFPWPLECMTAFLNTVPGENLSTSLLSVLHHGGDEIVLGVVIIPYFLGRLQYIK